MTHKPDFELDIMRRGLRDLSRLPAAGQKRVIAYWSARVPSLPDAGEQRGEQQLDLIEDTLPQRVRGAAA